MRILHIYKSYFPDTVGGIEQGIKNIIESTQRAGVEHAILTSSQNASTEEEGGVTITRLPTTVSISSCPVSISMLFKYRALVEPFDLLHYHFPWPFAEALHVICQIKKPFIVSYQSDIVKQKILKQFYWPFFKRFMSQASCIVAASQNYLATSRDLKPFLSRCDAIPVGIADLPAPESQKVTHWRSVAGEGFLLFVGVLRYYKSLHILLDALKGQQVPVVIAGDGPCGEALKAQAQKNGLTSVQFVGRVSDADKLALLHLCRGVVLPSSQRSEAYGVVLVEGLAAGKPLISTEIGTGTSFINQHGETGWVVQPDAPDELWKAIDALFSEDALAKKMGEAARARYEALFTAEKMGKAYQALYEKIL